MNWSCQLFFFFFLNKHSRLKTTVSSPKGVMETGYLEAAEKNSILTLLLNKINSKCVTHPAQNQNG